MGTFCSKGAKQKSSDNHAVKTPADPEASHYTSTQPAGAPDEKVDGMSVKAYVDKKIKDNKVVVFSKDYCPYCAKAKNALFSLLSKEEVDVEEINLMDNTDDIQDYLAQLTGGRSVPRVFINGKFIGGGDDTVRLKNSGELQKMLTAQAA